MCLVVVGKEQHRHMIRHSRVCRYNDVGGDADDAYMMMMMMVVVMMSMMMLVMIVMMVHGEDDDDVYTVMWCMTYDGVVCYDDDVCLFKLT